MDVVPTLVKTAGSPQCGFFTRVETQVSMKVTQLSLAVAVVPTGTSGEVDLAFEVEGDRTSHLATFRGSTLTDGQSSTPSGTTATYLVADLGILRTDSVTNAKVAALLGKPRVITVTVDPGDRIRESNERNNVLRLRVTPPDSRQTVAVKDNRCAER